VDVSRRSWSGEKIPVPEQFLEGDYENDRDFRDASSMGERLWREKDDLIAEHVAPVPDRDLPPSPFETTTFSMI
jgi:hypothetical protein